MRFMNSTKPSFWQRLKKPFLALAPMDDITDVVFREIIAKIAKPDVMFTEFTNVEGLNSPGKDHLLPRLMITPKQRPIVAQIWGKEPKNFLLAAELITDLGFDGIDINMGCPDRQILKQGCCAALINNQPLAKEIIKATKKGAPTLPISVKTRLGIDRIQTEEWISFLLKQNLSAITIHARTAKEMSKTPARWEEIAKAVTLRDKIAPQTLIIGNGDIESKEEGLEKASQTACDAVMIGRGVLHNPWIFEKSQKLHSANERINLLTLHLKLFQKTWGNNKNFETIKKFAKAYISNFEGALVLRHTLMQAHTYKQFSELLKPSDR